MVNSTVSTWMNFLGEQRGTICKVCLPRAMLVEGIVIGNTPILCKKEFEIVCGVCKHWGLTAWHTGSIHYACHSMQSRVRGGKGDYHSSSSCWSNFCADITEVYYRVTHVKCKCQWWSVGSTSTRSDFKAMTSFSKIVECGRASTCDKGRRKKVMCCLVVLIPHKRDIPDCQGSNCSL